MKFLPIDFEKIDISQILSIKNGFAFIALLFAVYLVAKVVGRARTDNDGVARQIGDIFLTVVFIGLVVLAMFLIYPSNNSPATVKLQVKAEAFARDDRGLVLRISHGNTGRSADLKLEGIIELLLKNDQEFVTVNLSDFMKEIEKLSADKSDLLNNIEDNVRGSIVERLEVRPAG